MVSGRKRPPRQPYAKSATRDVMHHLPPALRWAVRGLACLLALQAGIGRAQDAPGPSSGPDERFGPAVAAVEDGEYAWAIPVLLDVVRRAPAYLEPGRGSAAYWLGLAYQQTAQPDVATRAWVRGWTALSSRGRSDPRLADALIWNVFEQRDSLHYGAAAAAYLALLGHLDAGDLYREAAPFLPRHLAPLALILPEDVRDETGLTPATAVSGTPLLPGAGARLAAWWRSMDGTPATPALERLHEHLGRVVEATARFEDPRAALGFDARGETFIRFGPPSHTTPIGLGQDKTALATLTDRQAAFYPGGVFWVYQHVHETAHFLFVRDRGQAYRLGEPLDLLSAGMRARRNTLEGMRLMGDLYRRLALFYPEGHYGSAYEQIANYTGLLEDIALSRTLPSPNSTYKVPPPSPYAMASSLLSSARADDRRAIRRRDEQVPASYSNAFDEVEHLPVEVRWARFLDPDGTTRTELYWGLQTRELPPSGRLERALRRAGHPPSDAYLVDLTVVRQADDYREAARDLQHFLVPEPLQGPDAVLPAQTFVARGDTGRYHLAMQWDVYWAGVGEAVQRGPRVKLGSYRIDALEALRSDPRHLEMSDLKPLRVLDEAHPLDATAPYPQGRLAPGVALALYFELYHLAFGPDDQTHYRIAYEVRRTGSVEGGRTRTPRSLTASETSYTGSSVTAQETILLDLRDLDEDGAFELTVRATDETTGRTIARTLAFEVRP